MVPIQVIDSKDDEFGVFKFEQNGIDFFGLYPRDVIYMDKVQVHPDNFVGAKITTFLQGKHFFVNVNWTLKNML